MIDRDRLLSMPPIITKQRLTARDTILYALGVGEDRLPFVYEARLIALPTMAVVLAYPGFIWKDPDLGADWARVLHGEQFLVLHRPLPVEGDLVGETRIENIFDKGPEKGAIALVRRDIRMADGTPVATVSSTSFLRGDGGCGGPKDGAPAPHAVPDRAADKVVRAPTLERQAMLYRLSGDWNPLHIDPEVARSAGFVRPILHGLCTYGIVGRALLDILCAGDPARMRRIDCRFSAPLYPGETIETEIWMEGDGRAAFRARAVARDVVVMTNGRAESI